MHPPDEIAERLMAVSAVTADIAPDREFFCRLERALADRRPSTRDDAVAYLEKRAPLIAAGASLLALPVCTYSLMILLRLSETVWDLLMDVMV
jgi:hypothetical protein